MFKKILVGYDGSAGSKAALEQAVKLSKTLGSEITALWVRSSLPHYPETVDEIEEEKEAATSYFWKLKNEIADYAEKQEVSIPTVTESGNSAKTIVDYAHTHNIDLIVLGHSGHSGIWGRFLGHTPDKVTENAHCSVLIVR